MDATTQPATVSVTIQLPVDLLTQIDALCALSERTRTYWVTEALEEVIPSELTEARVIADEFAAIDAHPDVGLPNEQMDQWMVEQGLTTRDVLDRVRAARAHMQP